VETSQSEKPEWITGPSPDPPCQASARDQNVNNRLRPLSTLAMHLNHLDRGQSILGDISNIGPIRNRSLPVRRVFSDPVSSKALYFIAEEKPTNSDSTLHSDVSLTKEKPVLFTEVLPTTHDIALPYQDSIPQLPIKPLKNLNKIHSIPPSVSHACYVVIELFFISLAAPSEPYPFDTHWNNSPTANKYAVARVKDPQTRKRQPYYPSISFFACGFSGEPTTTRVKG
jgi:hypothetical protein